MLDHKKKAITEHWQFCPKCNLKLYRMTADCTGFIHIKCWRCRKMLWLDLSIRAKVNISFIKRSGALHSEYGLLAPSNGPLP